MVGAVGLAFAAALVGSGALVVTQESATVNISLPAKYVETSTTVMGSSIGGQFQTQRTEVTSTANADHSATGSGSTGGTYATGVVVFSKGCTSGPTCTAAPVPAGWQVCHLIQTGGLWCYVLQTAVTCFCGESVRVRATHAGSVYNAAANVVTELTWPSPWVNVTNPAPITGGSDPVSYPIVRQSDVDAATSAARAQLLADLQSALRVQAGGKSYIPDAAPSVSVTSDVVAGAHVGMIHAKASGTLGATTFSFAAVRALIAKALTDQVPAGYRLTDTPLVFDYNVKPSGQSGDLIGFGRAAGFEVRTVATDLLRSRLSGLGVSAARKVINDAVPGGQVQINLSPAMLPWLPINAGRISIVVVVGTYAR